MDTHTLPWLLALAAAGIAAGTLGGLLGLGAGSLMVPVLIAAYIARGIPVETAGLLAVATSLMAIIFLSGRSFLSHRRRGAGSLRAVLWMAPGGMVGAWGGAELALLSGGRTLVSLFAAFEFALGVKYLIGRSPQPAASEIAHRGALPWLATGFAAGALSSFFGIGGGIVAVPMLVSLLRLRMHDAIANSSGLIVFNALVGVLRYALAGVAPDYVGNVGWVDPRAGAVLALGALLGAPLGVRLAHGLKPDALRRAFGAFLIVVGILLWREVT